MSLILDALRRSERARQRSLQGRLNSVSDEPGRQQVQTPWAALIGVVLLVNAVALAALYWNGGGSPAQSSAQASQPSSASSASANTTEFSRRGPLRSLAKEAADADTATPKLNVTQGSALQAETRLKKESPSTVSKPKPAAAASQVATPSAGSDGGEATPLDALPSAVRQSLPKLHLDVHVYNANPKNRFVMINMHRYQRGDVLHAGPRVVRIIRDGVVLRYQGHRFLLPAQQP